MSTREMTYEELKYAYMKKVQRVEKLEKENKRYRKAIEYIKIELRDFRKDANTIKKLSKDRIVQGEAFRLSCDIRDCLKALEGEDKHEIPVANKITAGTIDVSRIAENEDDAEK